MYLLDLDSSVNTIAECNDVLICGLSSGKLLWYDKSGKIFFAENSIHKNSITDCAIVDNEHVLSSSADTTLKLFTMEHHLNWQLNLVT